jgi:hypothetical protein
MASLSERALRTMWEGERNTSVALIRASFPMNGTKRSKRAQRLLVWWRSTWELIARRLLQGDSSSSHALRDRKQHISLPNYHKQVLLLKSYLNRPAAFPHQFALPFLKEHQR